MYAYFGIKHALVVFGALIGGLIIGSLAMTLLIQSASAAEPRPGACAQLEPLYGHDSDEPLPGLHDARTSEELDGLARYLNLCWSGASEQVLSRLQVAQQRQIILGQRQIIMELRELTASNAEGRLR